MEFKTAEELLAHARKLDGKTIRKALEELPPWDRPMAVAEKEPAYLTTSRGGKGSFGSVIEEMWFDKKNDSLSRADFPETGVELKCSPLKRCKGGLAVKERLSLNMIDYNEAANETFETSHFLEKNRLLLLVFYIYDTFLADLDKEIDLTALLDILERDGDQIRRDWELIHGKIMDGRAHEISEGDTLYLGAAPKGAGGGKTRKQPFSSIPAKPRAYTLKVGYMNTLYKFLTDEKTRQAPRFMAKGEAQTFDDKIQALVRPYVGKTCSELEGMLGIPASPDNKARFRLIAEKMIGFNRKKPFYEFRAASVQLKTIRVEPSGNIKESMSFRNLEFNSIIHEDWEDSVFYEELTSKFLFMVFKREEGSNEYVFRKCVLWNMPAQDLDEAERVWNLTKERVAEGRYDELPKMKESPIAHVRTKGRDSLDLMPTPQGGRETKRCFWLRNKYIEKIVGSHQL